MILLLLVLACGSEPAAPQPAPAPAEVPPGKMRHAVVIVVDTLRADAIERARTPTLDRLAATGAQGGWAWTASTWTAPAVISLFSGMPVRLHGWDFPFPRIMAERQQSYPPLPEVPLLAQVLREQGFSTSGHFANGLLGEGLGYERGFVRWKHGDDAQVERRVTAEIQAWQPGERNFLYVHLFGPHHPLRPGKNSQARWGIEPGAIPAKDGLEMPEGPAQGPLEEQLYWRAYHAVVEDTDERLGRILDALQPHLSETLLVVTSDHGELLGEQGHHGHDLGVWEPLTRVPLVVKNGPLLPDRVTTAAVADLVTTGLGVEHAWPVRLQQPPALVVQREGAVALTVDGRSKAIWDERAYETAVMVDLWSDPDEARPLTPVSAELLAARQAWDATVPETVLQPVAAQMDASMAEALQALGYMEAP